MFFKYLQFIALDVFVHNRVVAFNKPARRIDRFLSRRLSKTVTRLVWRPICNYIFLPFTTEITTEYTLKTPYISYSQFKANVQWLEDVKAHIQQIRQEKHRSSSNHYRITKRAQQG